LGEAGFARAARTSNSRQTKIDAGFRAIVLALGLEFCAKIFMPCIPQIRHAGFTFSDNFFAPLLDLLAGAEHRRACPELSDEEWLRLGVRRAIEEHPSGRAFLQHLASGGVAAPEHSHFFETLKSPRRLALVSEVSKGLAAGLPELPGDWWSGVPELAGFDVYAGDGHFHAAAAHDPRDRKDGGKYAAGHFFSLNLRSHALSHLSAADQVGRHKEHDMHVLKRLNNRTLRQGAAKGRKVLCVWDRAGIDFRQWRRWKQAGGIYFLSREKKNMALEVIGENQWDRADPRNAGVLADELVSTSQGVHVRRVRYHCAQRGETFSFLTNECTLPPGVIAHLCRLRWEIEKVFDEFKNKLGETQAWASSANAKTMQAHFLCMAHNLMIRCEAELEREHGVRNEAELARRASRLEAEQERLAKTNAVLPLLVRSFQRLTVRSVKFIRWLRVQLFARPRHDPDIAALRHLYATL